MRAASANWRLPHEGVYVRLGVSGIHGVGVFAIRDIPEGTLVFGSADEAVRPIAEGEILRLPGEARRLYDDFCVLDAGHYMCPRSFNEITVAWYVNHSTAPNLACDHELRFVAARRIRKGEELTADYTTYAGPAWAGSSTPLE